VPFWRLAGLTGRRWRIHQHNEIISFSHITATARRLLTAWVVNNESTKGERDAAFLLVCARERKSGMRLATAITNPDARGVDNIHASRDEGRWSLGEVSLATTETPDWRHGWSVTRFSASGVPPP
jgi:hypothetical protein